MKYLTHLIDIAVTPDLIKISFSNAYKIFCASSVILFDFLKKETFLDIILHFQAIGIDIEMFTNFLT